MLIEVVHMININFHIELGINTVQLNAMTTRTFRIFLCAIRRLIRYIQPRDQHGT